jgi:hypothetical protein
MEKITRFFCVIATLLACSLLMQNASGQAITYVQGNYSTPQTPQPMVSVRFNSAQAAGDLNVVVVGWNDTTATVTSVSDTSGNHYSLAAGPTVLAGIATQAIYYAKNIQSAAAGINALTVTFSNAATLPDIRILEYNGADPKAPVDANSAGSGNSATSDSGSATTTNPTDLIFGANRVQTTTSGPGSGFTQRLLTSPDGDIAEDRMVSAAGSYSATALLSSSGQWIMQMVAFRTPKRDTIGPTWFNSPDVVFPTGNTIQVNVLNGDSNAKTGVSAGLVDKTGKTSVLIPMSDIAPGAIGSAFLSVTPALSVTPFVSDPEANPGSKTFVSFSIGNQTATGVFTAQQQIPCTATTWSHGSFVPDSNGNPKIDFGEPQPVPPISRGSFQTGPVVVDGNTFGVWVLPIHSTNTIPVTVNVQATDALGAPFRSATVPVAAGDTATVGPGTAPSGVYNFSISTAEGLPVSTGLWIFQPSGYMQGFTDKQFISTTAK